MKNFIYAGRKKSGPRSEGTSRAVGQGDWGHCDPVTIETVFTVKAVTVGNAPCLVWQGRSYHAEVQRPQRAT